MSGSAELRAVPATAALCLLALGVLAPLSAGGRYFAASVPASLALQD